MTTLNITENPIEITSFLVSNTVFALQNIGNSIIMLITNDGLVESLNNINSQEIFYLQKQSNTSYFVKTSPNVTTQLTITVSAYQNGSGSGEGVVKEVNPNQFSLVDGYLSILTDIEPTQDSLKFINSGTIYNIQQTIVNGIIDKSKSNFTLNTISSSYDVLILDLKNSNNSEVFYKDLNLGDKIVFNRKYATLTNKTIDVSNNNIINIKPSNVNANYFVDVYDNFYYCFTNSTITVPNIYTQDMSYVYAIYDNSDEYIINYLGEGIYDSVNQTMTYNGLVYNRNIDADIVAIKNLNTKFNKASDVSEITKLVKHLSTSSLQIQKYYLTSSTPTVENYIDTLPCYQDFILCVNTENSTGDVVSLTGVPRLVIVHTSKKVANNNNDANWIENAYDGYHGSLLASRAKDDYIGHISNWQPTNQVVKDYTSSLSWDDRYIDTSSYHYERLIKIGNVVYLDFNIKLSQEIGANYQIGSLNNILARPSFGTVNIVAGKDVNNLVANMYIGTDGYITMRNQTGVGYIRGSISFINNNY